MNKGTVTFSRSGLSSGGGYLLGKIEWQQTKDTARGESTVQGSIYAKKGHDSLTLTTSTGGTWKFSISMFGKSTNGVTTSDTRILTDWVKLGSFSVTVAHATDGSLSGSIGGSVTGPNGTSFAGLTTSGSQNVTLDAIPRASMLSSVSGGTIGSTCTVKWVPASASFGYKIKYVLKQWSYTTDAIAPGKTTAVTHDFTLPYEIAKQITTGNTGTMTVSLQSYSDKACTNLMGSDGVSLKVTVPDNAKTKPKVTSFTFEPINDGLPNSKFAPLFIQGKSKFKGTIAAETQYGAGIDSFRFKYGGLTTETNNTVYTSEVLPTAGTFKVEGAAIDTRGYAGYSDEYLMTVLEYSKPTLAPASGETTIVCRRCDEQGNADDTKTNLRIKVKRNYSKVISGETQYNFCTVKYRYKRETAASFSGYVTLLAGSDLSTDTVDTVIKDVIFAADTAYIVEITASDDIGETDVWEVTIPTEEVTIDCPDGGKHVGLLSYVPDGAAPGIYAGGPIFLKREGESGWDAMADAVIEAGEYQTDYGKWYYKKWASGTYQMFGKFSVTPTESTLHKSFYRTNSISIPSPFPMSLAIVSGSVTGYGFISSGGVSDVIDPGIAFRIISDEAISTTTAVDVWLSVVGTYET